ncbi:helix-turn-helix transcriptional regulator [uncultured Acetatifactor sp.]|jgi:transcriptional regulator with XRE-family HTH domain|uniref:helix-turn-helix domain-containing protein n=1 Tax=uncultured Acetatifactor sp. TaxID=1671927 RepID=UPI002625A1CC|nr:helix-turn-helix transcriptional regulator [uncultured Acetatifactor sp.]
MFIEEITKAMEQKKISAYQLEEDLGLSHSTVSSWKRGTQPTIEKAIKVIKYLGLSADEIFDIKPTKRTILTTTPPDYTTIRSDIEWVIKTINYSLGESDIKEKDSLEKNAIKVAEKVLQDINNAIRNVDNIS